MKTKVLIFKDEFLFEAKAGWSVVDCNDWNHCWSWGSYSDDYSETKNNQIS